PASPVLPYTTLFRSYRWVNLAGTSAGALVAALAAAGYRAEEMAQLLQEMDFRIFRDAPWWAKIPLAGPALALLLTKGLYKGDARSEEHTSELQSREN